LRLRVQEDCLYSRWMVGLADEARSDAIPEAASGVGGHGAARLHSVIRRLQYSA